ncbi:hypothetical protein BaRGS_00039623, partial [Batillaria attramentaria]
VGVPLLRTLDESYGRGRQAPELSLLLGTLHLGGEKNGARWRARSFPGCCWFWSTLFQGKKQ